MRSFPTNTKLFATVVLALAGCKAQLPPPLALADVTGLDADAFTAVETGGPADTDSSAGLTGLSVTFTVPKAPDNPLDLEGAQFLAAVIEGPDLPRDQYYSVVPFLPAKPLQVALPPFPPGAKRQVRVEVLKGENGKPSETLARGWTLPQDVQPGGPQPVFRAYVTRINAFAPIDDDGGKRAKTDARAGATAVALPDGKVLFVGGGVVKGSAKNPYDIKNVEKFHDSVLRYDPDTREILSLTVEFGAKLKVGRAFTGVAVGQKVVAIAGGWVESPDGPKPSNAVEFIPLDAPTPVVKSSTASKGDLSYARAAPSIVPMFDKEDFFLVLGGQGDGTCFASDACAGNTWEVWHPEKGVVAQGSLNQPRWNHATVRVPGVAGGYVVLIGGENALGPLAKFEVVQFTSKGEGKVSDANSPCPEKGTPDCPPGVLEHWKPYVGDMSSARVLPGAAHVFVNRPERNLEHAYLYMIGGFADSAKSKALASVDVLDLMTGKLVSNVPQLKAARGAPMVAVASNGSWPGQVLVAGGSSTAGSHHHSAEFLVVKPDAQKDTPKKVDGFEVGSTLVGGNRTLGVAIPLVTGHVLLGGGVGTDSQGLVPQNDLMVWNPY